MKPTAGMKGYKYPWPGEVVVKLRNLPQQLHKPGVIAAALQAAGYDADVRVGDHYRDVTNAVGDRIAGLPDRNVLCAIVRPPAEDPTLSRIPRRLQWPGVSGLVKFSAHPSQVVPVGSHSSKAGASYITETLERVVQVRSSGRSLQAAA
jgi:hypothetical protein